MDILLQADYMQWQDTPKHCRELIISDYTFDRIAKDDITMSEWWLMMLASYLAQFQFMIIIYKEISHDVN